MRKPAFTLIEIILYVGLTSIVITFVALFTTNVLERISRMRIAFAEQSEIAFVMERITRELQEAADIVVSASRFGDANSRIVFLNDGGRQNTIERTVDDRIRIVRPDGIIDNLTSLRIRVTDFTVTNLSRPKRSGVLHIRIQTSQLQKAFETTFVFREQIDIL